MNKMIMEKKQVAILTSSPALGSILSMVLDCEECLILQNFSRPQNLERHMRIVPIDLIVCDYDMGDSSAPELAISLRTSNLQRNFKMIVLAETMSRQTRQACKFAAIDEVIIKPMSPLFIRDRVLARLNEKEKTVYGRQEKPFDKKGNFPGREYTTKDNNVISLFTNKTCEPGDIIHPQ